MMKAKGRSRFLIWALFGTVPTLASRRRHSPPTPLASYGVEFQGYPGLHGSVGRRRQRLRTSGRKRPTLLTSTPTKSLGRSSTRMPGNLRGHADSEGSLGVGERVRFAPSLAPRSRSRSARSTTNLNEKGRRILDNTAISLLEVPGCDASAKDPAYLTIGLTPGAVHEVTPGATKAGTVAKSDQKPLLLMNFKLTIDGLDTTKVAKIEPITIKRSASGPEYSNLEIEVAETTMASWKQWAAQTFPTGEKGRIGRENARGPEGRKDREERQARAPIGRLAWRRFSRSF